MAKQIVVKCNNNGGHTTEMRISDEGHRGFHWTFFVNDRWYCEGHSDTEDHCHRDRDRQICPI